MKVQTAVHGYKLQMPLLRDRPARNGVTTYICENFACRAPLVGAEAVEKALQSKA